MQIEDDLEQVREDLGEAGYQWLAACAVAPVLRWELTTHLGRVLAQAEGRPVPDERATLDLIHLAWFRQGWMPDRVRRHLIADLTPANHRLVRRTLKTLLATGQSPRRGMAGRLVDLRRRIGQGLALKVRTQPPTPLDPLYADAMLGRTPRTRGTGFDNRFEKRTGIALRGVLVPQVVLPVAAILALGFLALRELEAWQRPTLTAQTETPVDWAARLHPYVSERDRLVSARRDGDIVRLEVLTANASALLATLDQSDRFTAVRLAEPARPDGETGLERAVLSLTLPPQANGGSW